MDNKSIDDELNMLYSLVVRTNNDTEIELLRSVAKYALIEIGETLRPTLRNIRGLYVYGYYDHVKLSPIAQHMIVKLITSNEALNIEPDFIHKLYENTDQRV